MAASTEEEVQLGGADGAASGSYHVEEQKEIPLFYDQSKMVQFDPYDFDTYKCPYRYDGPRQLGGPRYTFPFLCSRPADGKLCIQTSDRQNAENQASSLLFGELLPEGVSKMCDEDHLKAATSRVFYDLGMGCGKLILQAFDEFKSLQKVVGVELAKSRFELAEYNIDNYVKWNDKATIEKTRNKCLVTLKETTKDGRPYERILEFERGNMWARVDAFEADIVVMETQIPASSHQTLCNFLYGMKSGARLLTYENVENIYENSQKASFPIPCCFNRLPNNDNEDRFFTSWAQKRGHHFHLWERK